MQLGTDNHPTTRRETGRRTKQGDFAEEENLLVTG